MGNIENEFINLLYQLIFDFALVMYIQKQGIHFNDIDIVDAGRVEYRDLTNQVIYLLEVKSVLNQNVSFRSSHLDHNHQGVIIVLKGKLNNIKW